jgi:DNA-binding transcriptional regulator LsrR (DeoR family)
LFYRSERNMDEETVFLVARLYYEEKQTQEEISRRIKVSRSTVSRLLQEAVEKSIVTIKINYPWQRDQELERRLVDRFGLSEARVLDDRGRSEESVLNGVGALAARLIEDKLVDGDVVGVSYGRTVASAVGALSPHKRVRVTAVPLLGALGVENTSIDGSELVRKFAFAYGGDYRYIPGPLLVKDERTREALVQLPQIAETLAMARRANWILVGVGSISHTSLIWSGYIDHRGLERMRAQGAVGHMCGQFFDAQGRVLAASINRRTIGIGLKSLARMKGVVAVASGGEKAEAIFGALRGKYIGTLVTDISAASAILAMA